MALTFLLHILNSIQSVLCLALTAASIWFFVEVQSITSLRNTNHYLLDYKVYWPQALPWGFVFIGIFILFVSCCGFAGARKRNRGMVTIYVAFEAIAILGLVVATVVALTFADSQSTDQFIDDAIKDAYTNSKTNMAVADAFGNIERRLQCCGAGSPRDYRNWKSSFPPSCCDTYYHGWVGTPVIDCDFTNNLPNDRHSCSSVAVNYTRVVIKVLAGVSTLTAFVGVLAVLLAVVMLKSSFKERKPQLVLAPHEMDSKKMLL